MVASGEPRRMLREDEVLDLIPVSRSTLWRMIRAGKFPRGIHISANRVCWFASDITAWQDVINNENQPNRRRGPGRRKRVEADDRAATDHQPV